MPPAQPPSDHTAPDVAALTQQLLQSIAAEGVPPAITNLAQQLQAALDDQARQSGQGTAHLKASEQGSSNR